MTEADRSLTEQAQRFADDLSATLAGVLPDAPEVVAEKVGDRVVVRPERDVPVKVDGTRLASLEVHLRCRLDSEEHWLAVESSTYKLRLDLDRTPLLRFDYVRDANVVPCSHIQVHAHRGALSHLLSQAGHTKAHDMASLHIPLGGARFRPCLEDVLQFLVDECSVEHEEGWRHAIYTGRARWREVQASAVARDFPEEAASALEDMGYEINRPDEIPAPKERPRHAW